MKTYKISCFVDCYDNDFDSDRFLIANILEGFDIYDIEVVKQEPKTVSSNDMNIPPKRGPKRRRKKK